MQLIYKSTEGFRTLHTANTNEISVMQFRVKKIISENIHLFSYTELEMKKARREEGKEG